MNKTPSTALPLPALAFPGFASALAQLDMEAKIHLLANLYTFSSLRCPSKGKQGMGRSLRGDV
jgi:hypothetical protein